MADCFPSHASSSLSVPLLSPVNLGALVHTPVRRHGKDRTRSTRPYWRTTRSASCDKRYVDVNQVHAIHRSCRRPSAFALVVHVARHSPSLLFTKVHSLFLALPIFLLRNITPLFPFIRGNGSILTEDSPPRRRSRCLAKLSQAFHLLCNVAICTWGHTFCAPVSWC